MAVIQDCIDIIINIPGFSACLVDSMLDEDGVYSLMIELKRKEPSYECQCGRKYTTVYDSRERCVRDLSYGAWKRSWLVFWQHRVDCSECGIVNERFTWIAPMKVYTKRLAAAVALACREMRSIKSISEQFDLHWGTVKNMDKEALKSELPATCEASPRYIGVDEFSIKKRHHYGTAVVDLENRTIPYIAEHRKKESLAGFYKELGKEKCEKIRAVAMDMWPAYRRATRDYCSKAEIVYDPFHIISAYSRDVIDKVRVAEAKKAEKQNRSTIRGSRYLLLKNASSLDKSKNEHVRLSELLKLNRSLEIVYTLKDDLRQIWHYKSEAWAIKWFDGWYQRAMHSNITPLKNFAKKLKKHIDGIIAHCMHPIHTSILEGINNKIKVIKRISFGFRDQDYFFLKIRAAFMIPSPTPFHFKT